MHTPTDPYNSGEAKNPEEEILDPIEETTPSEVSSLPYGKADEMAWEKAFTGESAALAAEENSYLATENITAENPAAESLSSTEKLETAASTETEAAFSDLPPEVRSNATLHDVMSAHSAEEAGAFATLNEPPSEPLNTPLNEVIPALPPDPSLEMPEPAFLAAPDATPETIPADPLSAENRKHWAEDPGDEASQPVTYIPDAPPSRIISHIAVFFATLVLIPVAWYLISDAGARLNLVPDNPWDTGNINFAALLELAGGMLAIALIALMTRLSSLGAQVWGIILSLSGLAAIILPTHANNFIDKLNSAIGDYNPFTGNVVHHLDLDLGSGRIAIFGFLLFIFALAAHGARKRGAARQEILVRRELTLLPEEATKESAEDVLEDSAAK